VLEFGYQTTIAGGVLKAAKNGGASVLCFVGGVLGSPERGGLQRNHVFDLASSATVDGLVILSSTLVNYAGSDALARFVERYRVMPMCSIGETLPGMPSLFVDNDAGMRSVVEHLVVVHGYRRIAFIRGPLANAEADLRYRAYRGVLQAHGIASDDQLVFVGDYLPSSGRAAVAAWFDERHLSVSDIDAIVASNDHMAFGVLDALKERGIRVPSDVAVTGFDDVESARYSNPGLTTVRQPLEEQGREAVRVVLLALQRRAAQASESLRTELVVRGSCGCSGVSLRQTGPVTEGLLLGFEATLVSRRQHMLAELVRAARGTLVHAGTNWEARLITAVADELRGDQPGAVEELFDGYVQGLIDRGLDTVSCHELLDCLRREMLKCLRKDPEKRAQAEDLFQAVRLGIGRTTERVLGANRLRVEDWARQMSIVSAQLIGTFDLNDLRNAIVGSLPLLGIGACFVVLYDGQGPSAPTKFANLVLDFDARQAPRSGSGNQFATEELLPPEVLGDGNDLRNFLVTPLFFKKEILGYLVIEFDITQAFAYDAIRELIGAALKGAMLVRDVRQQKAELDSAMSLIRDDQARHAALVEGLRQLTAELEKSPATGSEEIRQRIVALLATGS
jgi:DNA-binding LacI/PurR family transcriptional regulator